MLLPRRDDTVCDTPLKLAMTQIIFTPIANYFRRPGSYVDLLLRKTVFNLVFASHSLAMWALTLLDVDASKETGRDCRVPLPIWMPHT